MTPRLRRSTTALFVAALVAAGCGGDDAAGPATTVPAAEDDDVAADPAPDEAPDDPSDAVPGETTPDGGDFAVVFPGDPRTDTIDVPIDDTTTVVTQLLTYETAEGDALLASWVDYPDDLDTSDTDTLLEGARDGSLQNVAGQLVDSEFITLEGRPGIAYAGDIPLGDIDGVYLARSFLDGNRLYQIVAIGEAGTGFEASGEAFLDSFRFTGPPRDGSVPGDQPDEPDDQPDEEEAG